MVDVASKREKTKNRKTRGSFLRLRHDILESDAYKKLSSSAVKLIIDLAAQYRGKNNGDLSTAWVFMKKRGWRSKSTLYKAMKEAEEKGFIFRTRQGGINKCNLFAITWESIDECGGKLDVRTTNVASNSWKLGSPVQKQYQPSTEIVPIEK